MYIFREVVYIFRQEVGGVYIPASGVRTPPAGGVYVTESGVRTPPEGDVYIPARGVRTPLAGGLYIPAGPKYYDEGLIFYSKGLTIKFRA